MVKEPFPPALHSSFSRRLRRRLSRWLDQREVSESAITMFTALVVGIGSGLGAVIFRGLISGANRLSYQGLGDIMEGIAPYHLLVIPTFGGLIVGILIYRFAREAKGHGVPEVMEAVAIHGGRIRPRVAVIKALASSICIGSGGSVGREGPIVQIGSALGATLGQTMKLSAARTRNLVACGAAGGIAATFNAPIAGAIFAVEIILGRFATRDFGAVVISAVTADVIGQAFMGDLRTFVVPEYSLVSPWELLLYATLGVMAAVAAVIFSRGLYLMEDLWEKMRLPEYAGPAVGGLVLGVIGIFTFRIGGYPRVFGVGYETINDALVGRLAIQVTLALIVIKLLATSVTLGSGGSGGVLAPSLFMGAMLGNAFGQLTNQLFPQITAPSGAYALVGMSAFFSGAAHAPVTAIIILFEMTRDYHIILPLMLATVVSTLVSSVLSRESIYTLKLSRRGLRLEHGQDVDVMQGVTVGEVMTTDMDVVPLDMPLEDLAAEFRRTRMHGFSVVTPSGELAGMVSVQDLDRVLAEGSIQGKKVADIATTKALFTTYPHEPMGVALRRLGIRGVGRLPVLEREGSKRVVGVIRRTDIVRAYNHAITKRAQHLQKAEEHGLSQSPDMRLIDLEVLANSPAAGIQVREIALPEESLILSLQRGDEQHVVRGDTVLRAGDKITVFAGRDVAAIVRERLLGTEAATRD
ncbi:MAG: chloride channel protein [Acidobacteriota bacterium]